MSVSEPRLLERIKGDASSHTSDVDAVEPDLDMDGFEQMLVCTRVQMRQRFLLKRGIGRIRLERAATPGDARTSYRQKTVPSGAT